MPPLRSTLFVARGRPCCRARLSRYWCSVRVAVAVLCDGDALPCGAEWLRCICIPRVVKLHGARQHMRMTYCVVHIMSDAMPSRTVPWTLPGSLGCCSGGDCCSGSTSAEVMKRQRLDATLVACCAASEGPAGQGVEWGAMRASNLDRISRTPEVTLSKAGSNVALKTLLVCPTAPHWRRNLLSSSFVIALVACVAPFAAMASRFQGVHKESTGYKMLAALGWREGEGLVSYARRLLPPMRAMLPLTRVCACLQGAMKQGITEHIRVKKIHEKTGVGAVPLSLFPARLPVCILPGLPLYQLTLPARSLQAEAAVKARDWTLGMVAYDRVLAALTEVTSHHAARETDSGSDGEERVVSPTEVAAAKAAAKAVRAARKAAKAAKVLRTCYRGRLSSALQPHKPGCFIPPRHADNPAMRGVQVTADSSAAAQPAGDHTNLEADGSAASSKKKRKQRLLPAQDPEPARTEPAAAEAAVPAEPEAKRVRRATHVGRFKRREAGKRVRGYSSDDLTAILGGQPQAAAAVPDESASLQVVAERAASPETPSASEPPKPTSSDVPQPEGVGCEPAVSLRTWCSLRRHVARYRGGCAQPFQHAHTRRTLCIITYPASVRVARPFLHAQ